MKTKIFLIVTAILLLLSIVGIATAQNSPQTILRQGSVNSSEVTLSGVRDNIYITVRDTGSTYTDSIYVYAVFKDPYREILLSGVNQDTRTIEQALIPGPGSTGGWNMPTLGAAQFKVTFANQQSVTNRTTWITVVGTSSALGINYVGPVDVEATVSDPINIGTIPSIQYAVYNIGYILNLEDGDIVDSSTGSTAMTQLLPDSTTHSLIIYNAGSDTIFWNTTGDSDDPSFTILPGANRSALRVNTSAMGVYFYRRDGSSGTRLEIEVLRY